MATDRFARSCLQVKPDGKRCRANALIGSSFCYSHDPHKAAERVAARRAGGVARSRKAAVSPVDTPGLRLRSASDVAALLGETMNQVRRGVLDARVANAVGHLASILLEANERAEAERRAEELENRKTKPYNDFVVQALNHFAQMEEDWDLEPLDPEKFGGLKKAPKKES